MYYLLNPKVLCCDIIIRSSWNIVKRWEFNQAQAPMEASMIYFSIVWVPTLFTIQDPLTGISSCYNIPLKSNKLLLFFVSIYSNRRKWIDVYTLNRFSTSRRKRRRCSSVWLHICELVPSVFEISIWDIFEKSIIWICENVRIYYLF